MTNQIEACYTAHAVLQRACLQNTASVGTAADQMQSNYENMLPFQLREITDCITIHVLIMEGIVTM